MKTKYGYSELASGRFGVHEGCDCFAECGTAQRAAEVARAMNIADALGADAPDKSKGEQTAGALDPRNPPLPSRDEITSAVREYFDHAIDNRRLVKASLRDLGHAIDIFLDDSGWKDSGGIEALSKYLRLAAGTLDRCADNAAVLATKRSELGAQLAEREKLDGWASAKWMKWMVANDIGG